MAHFAEINSENIVQRVIVVSNDVLLDENRSEQETLGASFCENLFGGTWKQTSYNNNIRKRFAALGHTFDATKDAFITPRPYASWTLNADTCEWEAPVSYPSDGNAYHWDETNRAWSLTNDKE